MCFAQFAALIAYLTDSIECFTEDLLPLSCQIPPWYQFSIIAWLNKKENMKSDCFITGEERKNHCKDSSAMHYAQLVKGSIQNILLEENKTIVEWTNYVSFFFCLNCLGQIPHDTSFA